VNLLKKSRVLLMILAIMVTHSEETFAKSTTQKLDIHSEGSVVVDSKSGQILYKKNDEEQLYPASITKIATISYALEKKSLDDQVTISENAANTEGSSVYIEPGEVLPLKQLMEGMMLKSGNDAAVAVAEYAAGDMDQFVVEINEFLKNKVGVTHTHFVTPSGLFDENHYTTPLDMALITNYAIKNPDFKELFGMKEAEWHSASWDAVLTSKHRMINGDMEYEGVTGGKNGFIDESKNTLVTTATKNSLSLTVVTMGANSKKDIYEDTKNLLDYGFDHFETKTIHEGTTYKNDSNTYAVQSDFTYDSPKGEKVVSKVDSKGQLHILTIKKDELAKVQLVKVKSKELNPNQSEEKTSSHFLFWLLIFLIFVILLFLNRLRIRRERRRRRTRYQSRR
jgi:D-alanyl-D-alanine carboxypeptidase (penicillin-binding protein 5/6)